MVGEGKMVEWMEGRFCNASNLTNLSVLLFITRRGIVHAAGEGRHLHGGHCLVRKLSYMFADKAASSSVHSFTVSLEITVRFPLRSWTKVISVCVVFI